MNHFTANSIYTKALSPYLQAGIIFGAGLVINVLAKVINLVGLLEVAGRFHWKTALAFLLLFSIFNSVYSLSTKNTMKYWGQSVYSFLGLAVVSGFFAYLMSGENLNDAGSMRWIYFVVTIGYLVFLSMVNLMRKIVEFAEREEWNQPRKRRR